MSGIDPCVIRGAASSAMQDFGSMFMEHLEDMRLCSSIREKEKESKMNKGSDFRPSEKHAAKDICEKTVKIGLKETVWYVVKNTHKLLEMFPQQYQDYIADSIVKNDNAFIIEGDGVTPNLANPHVLEAIGECVKLEKDWMGKTAKHLTFTDNSFHILWGRNGTNKGESLWRFHNGHYHNRNGEVLDQTCVLINYEYVAYAGPEVTEKYEKENPRPHDDTDDIKALLILLREELKKQDDAQPFVISKELEDKARLLLTAIGSISGFTESQKQSIKDAIFQMA